MKKVIDIYGKEVIVDDENKTIRSFNNVKQQITYSAEVIRDGEKAGVGTEYVERGVVTDIEEKLKTWNNKLYLVYASMVDFQASKNDPDKKSIKSLFSL